MMSKQGRDPPVYILDETSTNLQAYSWRYSRSSSNWFDERLRMVTKSNNYCTTNHRKTVEKISEVERSVVLKPTNDLFTNTGNYHQYRLIKKLARYDDDMTHGLGRMPRRLPSK